MIKDSATRRTVIRLLVAAGVSTAALTVTGLALAATPSVPAAAEIRSENLSFVANGERIAATLFLPDGSAKDPAVPAVIVTGAWMTVKEQMPTRYARELAARGIVALVFDFRGWGESGGARRRYEDPYAKIADIKAAIAYLATQPGFDPLRIGALGVCASAGYVVTAASDTPEIRSVALVAPWLHDAEVIAETYGGTAGVAKLQAVADAAEDEYRRSGRQRFVPAASMTDSSAIMFEAPYYTERHRGMNAEWRNEADPAFWHGWLAFDGIATAPRVEQPLLMVHSEAAAIPQGARRFYARLNAPKRELWLNGVSQFDFYDRDEPVKLASDAVAAHFKATLDRQENAR